MHQDAAFWLWGWEGWGVLPYIISPVKVLHRLV